MLGSFRGVRGMLLSALYAAASAASGWVPYWRSEPRPVIVAPPAMIRSNRPKRDNLSDVWMRHWCACNEGRSFASPMLEPLPSPWFWKQDRGGWAWRIYRGAA